MIYLFSLFITGCENANPIDSIQNPELKWNIIF